MAAYWPSAPTYRVLRCRLQRPSLRRECLRIGLGETQQAGIADGLSCTALLYDASPTVIARSETRRKGRPRATLNGKLPETACEQSTDENRACRLTTYRQGS